MVGGKGKGVAVAHQHPVKAGEGGVVSFADDAVEGALLLVCCLVRHLDGKAVKGVEVVAGDDGAAVKALEMLNALDVLHDQLFIIDQLVNEGPCRRVRRLRLGFGNDAFSVVVHVLGL